jgi:DNA (cytosine-5)-methyltransferase 1
VDDGLPRTVDGASYSRAKWRKESLKAYGNAIVPAVAMEIFRAIKLTPQ